VGRKRKVVVILFGVSGAGKSTIGKLLTTQLGWRFYEADDFHPPANIDKMRRGIALTDQDRQPWLASLRRLIRRCLAAEENAILACSALKRSYRRYLRVNSEVKLVFLRGEYALIAERLRGRRGHFMKPELLHSQFADLEEPHAEEEAVVIDLSACPPRTPRELVEEIRRKLKIKN
jgi:gluconokinase